MSDHDIDVALSWLREANDSSQRIVGSATADVHGDVRRHGGEIQDPRINDEQVDIGG